MTTKAPVIILVGPIASGKGEAVSILEQAGYFAISYGDVIGRVRRTRGLPEKRTNSNAVGSDLRLRYGNDIIAKMLSQSVVQFQCERTGSGVVIDGLRHPAEVTFLRQQLSARVVGISASFDIRYARAVARNRMVDPKKLNEFREVDQEDRGGATRAPHENQTDACLSLADVIVENEGSDLTAYRVALYEAIRALGIELSSSPTICK